MSKVIGLIKLLRPINCLMMGLAVLIGEVITSRALYFRFSLLGFVTGFTLTGASMITNDYFDKAVDTVNSPNRPIASGLISIKLALFYAFTLITIGLLTAVAIRTSLIPLLLAIASISISLLYSYRGKKLGLLGNFMVSICIAIPLLYGSFLNEGGSTGRLGIIIFFSLMVFLANTGREVNKGIADIEGDKIRGVRTVALRFGSKNAAFVASLFYLSAVVLSIFPWLLSLTSWIYLLLVIAADLGFAISSFILVHNYSKESAVKVKKMVLIWMVVGLLAFVAGVP